jgi:exopolysaccharide biosynthesis polyprenyl glycosylphosphotransferase
VELLSDLAVVRPETAPTLVDELVAFGPFGGTVAPEAVGNDVALASRRLKRSAFLLAASLATAAASFASLGLAHLLVDGVGLSQGYYWLAALSAVSVGVLTLRSRPDRERSSRGLLEEWVRAGREAVLTGLLLIVVAFFWRPEPIRTFSFSRGTVLAYVLVAFVLISLTRSGIRAVLLALRGRGHNLAQVLVVGDTPSAHAYIRTVSETRGTGFLVAAHLRDVPEDADLGVMMERITARVHIDEIIVASHRLSTTHIQEMLSTPGTRQIKVRAVPELFGLPPSKVQVQPFEDFPLLTLGGNPVRGAHWRVKRTLDVLVAGAALCFLSPALALIAFLVRRSSPGPILFRQQRVGMDGKSFDMLKFRSMRSDTSDEMHREYMTSMLSNRNRETAGYSVLFKLMDDPRVTPVGKVLRRFSLDELPQLLNVLKGEMSLVGPRPALNYEVALYEGWERRRLDVLPGITGLWQVSGRSRLSPADMVRLDVHYAETWSLPSDFRIMAKTLAAVLRNEVG